ncbi:hypothetical protein ACFLT8_02650 [Chloroflexota bacterium]
MERNAQNVKNKTQDDARKLIDEAYARASLAYKEAKKQADLVHKEASKIAIDKQAKKVADEAHKKAIEEVKKLRGAIVAEAMVVFRSSYDQADLDYIDTTNKSREAIKDAISTYEEARKQTNIIYQEAKKLAVDGQAKKGADEAYKKAIKQAEQARDETTRKLE